MLRNHIRIILRTIYKSKFYFITSIGGLSVGIAASLLIALYVHRELHFDNFHDRGDRIVRIISDFDNGESARKISKIPFPAKAVLLQDFPEVEKIGRFMYNDFLRSAIRYRDITYMEEPLFADPEVLQVFDFELVQGDRNSALTNDNSILMTERCAIKYFGEDDPIGKTIRFQNDSDLTVTGIIKDLPSNSHIQFEILIPMNFQRFRWKNDARNNSYDFEEDWLWNGAWTYALLKKGVDPNSFEKKISQLPLRYYPVSNQKNYQYSVQSLETIHLTPDVSPEMSASGNTSQLFGFGAIAVLILIMAVINYTNLVTAQAQQRAKEVGLRKVLGAVRFQLISRFLGESVMVSLVAAILGVVLAFVMLPWFNAIMATEISLSKLLEGSSLAAFLAFIILVGIIGGLYPSLLLTKMATTSVIKGVVANERSSVLSFRSVLVIVQLLISTLMIAGIMVISRQLEFIKNKSLGFDHDQIIILKAASIFGLDEYETLKQQLNGISGVQNVYRGYFPGRNARSGTTFELTGSTENFTVAHQNVDSNFTEMFGLTLVSGRDFTSNALIDTLREALVNEKASKLLGFSPDELVGKELSYTGGNDNKTHITLKIVGVIRDANFESLYQEVRPLIMELAPFGDIGVKVNSTDYKKILADIESAFKTVAPEMPMEYNFHDQEIDKQYTKEEKLASSIQYFTVIAVVISCAGLVGLSTFMAQRRRKEIAIRKVCGAVDQNIVFLLTNHFVKLSLIGIVLAVSASVWLSSYWLQSFAYKIRLEPWIFIQAASITLLLVVLAVIFQVIRAAVENPIKSLRE